MENYTLKENEVILYRGSATLLPNGKSNENNAVMNDLILTNFNIVITVKKKKLLKTVTETLIYSISDIKIHDEKIQVIRRKTVVDIYLKATELFLDFKKEKEAKLFCDNALKEISGESKLVRSVKKTKKAIKETNEALDIDVLEIAKATATTACEAASNLGTVKGIGKGTQILSSVANTLLGNSKKKKNEQLLTLENKNSNDPQNIDKE